MLDCWISRKYLVAKDLLKTAFASNKPFEHLVLPDFFDAQKIRFVAQAVSAQKFAKQESDLYSFEQTEDLKSSGESTIKDFYDFFSKEMLRFVAGITQTSLSSIDMSAFIYDSCDYLLPHDDLLEGRRIAYVLNLTENFTKKDGGELVLFATKNNKPITPAKKIPPAFNTLVLFKVSYNSFHQVKEVLSDKKRLTIGGWFHG